MHYKLCTILTATLLLLAACSGARHERMQQQLAALQAMNQADSVLTDDSLAQTLADWFDRHGTPNEQMEAHYLLGRTHADRGETPAAIDCYLDAAACADTTADNCDFYKLASVYAQMASLYHQQLLFSYELEAHRKASHYNYLAKDTLHALYEQKMTAGIYALQNKKDSAETILLNTIRQYHVFGLYQEELQTSTMLMSLCSEHPGRLDDLKLLIKCFDERSTIYSRNNQPLDMHLYYCYKARYFEGTNQLDSAELFYRKMHFYDMPLTSLSSMYKGLLSVFSKRGQADSISKYARLYCSTNDSSVAIKDQELTARLAASYQYNIIQKESNIHAEKARKANMRLYISSLFLLATVAISATITFYYRRQRRKQKQAYFATIAERARLQEELNSLKAKDYDAVIARKEEEIAHLTALIAKREATYREFMLNDKLSVFESSSMVKTFSEKSSFKKDYSDIDNKDWEELVKEFSKDMPSAYSMLKILSNLQLHVCILLLLDYDETVIANLKNTKPQTINNAKARANFKLFNSSDSASLKSNLKRLIVA